MSEYVNEVNEGNFEQVVLQSEKPVLVDFWAQWCRPCGELAPVVESVAEHYAKSARVVKLNVDQSPAVAQRYGIQGIPTLILFQEGKERERIIGLVSREKVARTIGAYVDSDLNSGDTKHGNTN
jgi:thioredoxin 1